MIDGIIKADGTSRLMRATLPATYEEFKAQAAAGTLPLDVLFNAEGWSQYPTFLNKANLLKDATADLFGLGNDAVPNSVFSWLGQYNTHWWSREGAVPATYILGDENTEQKITGRGYTRNVYYSNSVSVDNGGKVSLAAPVSNFVVYGVINSDDPDANELENLNAIKGKYFYVSNAPNDIYYRTSTVNAHFDSGSVVSARPVYGVPATVDGEVSYIHSTDRNAYPDSGTVDGLTYQYLGIPFDNAVTAPKIATGSYIGTGTYGSKNPSSLTFDFVPKLILFVAEYRYGYPTPVQHPDTQYYDRQSITTLTTSYVEGAGFGLMASGNRPYGKKSADGKTVSWYNKNSAEGQFNMSGVAYHYIAIG